MIRRRQYPRDDSVEDVRRAVEAGVADLRGQGAAFGGTIPDGSVTRPRRSDPSSAGRERWKEEPTVRAALAPARAAGQASPRARAVHAENAARERAAHAATGGPAPLSAENVASLCQLLKSAKDGLTAAQVKHLLTWLEGH